MSHVMDRPWVMYGTCWGMAGVYVGTMHALPQLVSLVRTRRWAPVRSRDHPRTMCERLWCASLATLMNVVWTCRVLARQDLLSKQQPFRFLDALAWLGLPMPRLSFLVSHWLPFHPSLSATILQGLRIIGNATLLTSLLYLGTFWTDLHAHALPGQSGYYDESGPRPRLFFWRNYVIGPATEELVFRSCIVATMSALCPTMSRTKVMLVAPVFFGAAHLHHFFDRLTAALQFAYTTVFGWYATFLFQRTGTVWAPLAAHVLCNFMGLPRLGPRGSTFARIVDVALHIAGIAAFFFTRYPLTSLVATRLYSQ
ncbi:CAAX prenyl protease [Malassezia caprae]|uniref:intramembrane prenyl-peptidase Rce1 n=1 Tax=Malassezia caprae TaxID=1381934 RepID=A0AAF0IW44_9BASI|nr:CAAX prenyl protease [Malassezia caprae]